MLFHVLWTVCKILLISAITLKIISKVTMGWCKSNTCLVGTTVLITGGNSGLGYETALALAGRGAKVIIADVADMEESVSKIKEETGNPLVRGKSLDLASLESVRRFCKEIYKEESSLDILINNAGVIRAPLSSTKDGLRTHMQVNYFGHFLLTHLFIDLLKKAHKGRIIFVSSFGAFFNNLTLQNLNNPTVFSNKAMTHFITYCNSKLCELIASNIFGEKLRKFGITSNAVYPGVVHTPIVNKIAYPNYLWWCKIVPYFLVKTGGKTPYEGAQTQIHCALSRDLENVTGEFFMDCLPFYQPSLAKNRDFCKKIWEKSEELVKLGPEEKLESIL